MAYDRYGPVIAVLGGPDSTITIRFASIVVADSPSKVLIGRDALANILFAWSPGREEVILASQQGDHSLALPLPLSY